MQNTDSYKIFRDLILSTFKSNTTIGDLTKIISHCGMHIPLSDDEHRFVQKVHIACANGHWERRCNSNPVATLPHTAVVLYATI